MATTVLSVPGGIPNGHVLYTEYGKYVVAAGAVTVDIRLAKALMAKGYTSATLPNPADVTVGKTITLQAPAGVGTVQHDGRNYAVSGGSVTVPKTAVPALILAGFTN